MMAGAASMALFVALYNCPPFPAGKLMRNTISCGGEGHFARECPEPRKPMGACFNCGEEG